MNVWTFDKYKEKKKELDDNFNILMGRVTEYIYYDENFRKKYRLDVYDDLFEVIDLIENDLRKKYYLKIKISDFKIFDIELKKIEFDNIIRFCENPEMYKSSTKYNL